jgi:hypothetical protein
MRCSARGREKAFRTADGNVSGPPRLASGWAWPFIWSVLGISGSGGAGASVLARRRGAGEAGGGQPYVLGGGAEPGGDGADRKVRRAVRLACRPAGVVCPALAQRTHTLIARFGRQNGRSP